MGGWAVANGWVPGKAFYVDGQNVGGVTTVERHDVVDIVKSWGWQVDDGVARHCDVAATNAPCDACMGLFQLAGPVTPGVHRVSLCASGRGTADRLTPPDLVCDTKTVIVQ